MCIQSFEYFNFEKQIINYVVSDLNGWDVDFPIMIVSHIIQAMIIMVIEMKPVVATYTLQYWVKEHKQYLI